MRPEIRNENSMDLGMQADFRKAGARRIFQLCAVENINFPAHVIDYFPGPKVLRDMRQTRTMNAERTGDLFLRERDFIALLAVLDHQQPAAESLFDDVIAVADRALRDRSRRGLRR